MGIKPYRRNIASLAYLENKKCQNFNDEVAKSPAAMCSSYIDNYKLHSSLPKCYCEVAMIFHQVMFLYKDLKARQLWGSILIQQVKVIVCWRHRRVTLLDQEQFSKGLLYLHWLSITHATPHSNSNQILNGIKEENVQTISVQLI